jgi:histidinol phosphatase-like PHP family hydrolase
VSASIDELLDAVAEAGMLIEANTSGFDKPAKEMYASPGILKAACDRGSA